MLSAVCKLLQEARVGAVFQHATHEICQQVVRRARGGVHPDWRAGVVEGLPHPVQALEFTPRSSKVGQGGHREHVRHRASVVRSKRRVLEPARVDQKRGACQVGHVSVSLGGPHRVRIRALNLRLLDLTVPVGAFDQPHAHIRVRVCACHLFEELQRGKRAAAVSLHCDADVLGTVSAHGGFEHGQGHLEPVLLLSVNEDGEVISSGANQPPHCGGELRHRGGSRELVEARAEAGEFDGHLGLVYVRRSRNVLGGVDVGLQVPPRVISRARPLAEHVERVRRVRASPLGAHGATHGSFDVGPQRELIAEDSKPALDARLQQPRGAHRGAQRIRRGAVCVQDLLHGREGEGGAVDE
mmetsp:Transcript_37637/g.93572  ORF Transcript_37637/g.93572 Transcript_37637/m.93572 type:complete len:355 (-) Transcript_37637:612-1676(-)